MLDVILLSVMRYVVARILLILFMPFLLCVCGLPSVTGSGYVQGAVLGWPAAPQGGGTIPAKDASVRFLDTAGREVAVASTDSRGAFSASPPAGRYQIDVRAFGQDPIIESANGKPTKTTPVFVTVMAGEVTKLQLVVFTGIL